MAKYRKKTVVVEAARWWKLGDHPAVTSFTNQCLGKSSFFYANYSNKTCKHFGDEHGWIETLGGGHIVCPGDWIITRVAGEHYPCKPDIFDQTYEEEQKIT